MITNLRLLRVLLLRLFLLALLVAMLLLTMITMTSCSDPTGLFSSSTTTKSHQGRGGEGLSHPKIGGSYIKGSGQ